MCEIISKIRIELDSIGGAAMGFEMLRAKAGVHVYRCLYNGRPAVVKFFEKEGDRREIRNYRLLMKLGVPVVEIFALGERCIVMEDIGASELWRLGEEADMADPRVLRELARWYFALHEAGRKAEQLDDMWSENDELKEETIASIRERLPGSEKLCDYVQGRLDWLRALIRMREDTLTYNDFYYTNFLVRKDKSAAMMFDYNYMGRGYRYADFRNVQSSVSEEAFAAFLNEYSAMHRAKYGTEYEISEMDRRLDSFLSPFLGLANALGRERFPTWAEEARKDALSGTLLKRGEEIFEDAQR